MGDGLRPGDWVCTGCGDHQFARNVVCRKCGTPKIDGGDPGMMPPPREFKERPPMEFKEGDWHCTRCGDHQFEKNKACRKCGAPKPGTLREFGESKSEFKDGDWSCAECGDHQFERNRSCRKCGAPKPGEEPGESKHEFKEGDWNCPRCGDHVFAKNRACRKCGEPKPGSFLADFGESTAEFKEGDWNCQQCGDHQFERNIKCRKCGAPRPIVSSNNQAAKLGDWICPNATCKDVQFERNIVCRRCGTPRPQGVPHKGGGKGGGHVTTILARGFAGGGPAMPMAAPFRSPGGKGGTFAPDDWMCGSCGDHQFAKNIACRKCGAPKPIMSKNNQVAKMGDWICPNPGCQDVQFERNAVCRRCNTPKPLMPAPIAGGGGRMPMAGGFGAPAFGAMPGMMSVLSSNRQSLKPGDWICPNSSCRDIQFGKNEVCRRCGTPKPIMSTNKQVFKAGDWICPNPDCKDIQFEKNTSCRKCGTPKPEGEARDRSRSPAR